MPWSNKVNVVSTSRLGIQLKKIAQKYPEYADYFKEELPSYLKNVKEKSTKVLSSLNENRNDFDSPKNQIDNYVKPKAHENAKLQNSSSYLANSITYLQSLTTKTDNAAKGILYDYGYIST